MYDKKSTSLEAQARKTLEIVTISIYPFHFETAFAMFWLFLQTRLAA